MTCPPAKPVTNTVTKIARMVVENRLLFNMCILCSPALCRGHAIVLVPRDAIPHSFPMADFCRFESEPAEGPARPLSVDLPFSAFLLAVPHCPANWLGGRRGHLANVVHALLVPTVPTALLILFASLCSDNRRECEFRHIKLYEGLSRSRGLGEARVIGRAVGPTRSWHIRRGSVYSGVAGWCSWGT